MSKLTLLVVISLLFIASCGTLPIKTEIEDNHFRFENFVRNVQQTHEYISLMCFRKRPTGWHDPRQHPAGENILWVVAQRFDPSVHGSYKQAVVKFDVDLEAGRNYMPNRQFDGDQVSLWLQDVESGERVSEIKTTEYSYAVALGNLRERQCESSTI